MQGAAQQGMNEQICDPEEMQGAAQQGMNEQICDPNEMQGAIQHGFYQPVGVNNEFNVMMGMFQTLLAQQQTMLQMMQMMLLNMNRPAPFAPKFPVPFPQNVPAPFAGNMPNPFPGKTPMKQGMQIPPEAQEIFKKRMQKYQTRKVDKPVEKPNVIGINPAKVTRPEHSAAEVLDHVLSGIFKNGYSRTQDLFEQGLSSLDTVKIVTRCGEHGYALKMQDIYMKSTFEELVKCMKPGE
jgi:aryl carrier-like protein